MPTEVGHELSGSIEIPAGLVRGAALYAHCFTCTKQSKAAVEIGGRRYELTRAFIDRVTQIDLLDEVSMLRVPLMFLHSPTDQAVGVENATKLFKAAKHPKNFVSLFGADHLLTDVADAHFAADVIAAWANRYMPDPPPVQVPAESVLVRTGNGRFGTEVMTGTHQFLADEPKSYGGEESGPTLY